MLTRWVLLFLFLFLPVLAGAATLERECVDEPVFDGSVCVYQTNRSAANSVLLVHGINGSARFDWEHQIPALAGRYHVVAVDLPGFGDSSKGRKPYTPDNYARLLAFITDRYIDGPYALVGHSMGAVVALRYAARHAGPRLQRMVLIDAAGILHGVALSKALAGSYASRVAGGGFSAFVSRMTGKLLEGLEGLPFSPDDILNKPPEVWMRDDPAATAALGVAAADMSADIAAAAAPTLVIWGEKDKVAPLRTGRVLEARLKDARLVVVSGAGHVPMRDRPQQVNALLEAFLVHGPGHAGPAVVPVSEGEEGRIGRCDQERGKTFTGRFRRIELRHCDGVVIHDARVDEIRAFETRLRLIDSEVVSDGTAVDIVGSELEATASRIEGAVAIASSRSRLDLAGVELVGREAALEARTTTNVVFSVSEITSPHTRGYVHGFRELNEQKL